MFTKTTIKIISLIIGVYLTLVSVGAANISFDVNSTRNAAQIEELQIVTDNVPVGTFGVTLRIRVENAEVQGFKSGQTFAIGTCDAQSNLFDQQRVCVDFASSRVFTSQMALGNMKLQWGNTNGEAKITVDLSYYDGEGNRLDQSQVITTTIKNGVEAPKDPVQNLTQQDNQNNTTIIVILSVLGFTFVVVIIALILFKKISKTGRTKVMALLIGVNLFSLVLVFANSRLQLDILPKTGGVLNTPQVSVICDVLALKARVTYSIGGIASDSNYYLEFSKDNTFENATWATEVFNSVGTVVIPDDDFDNTQDGTRFEALLANTTYYIRLIEFDSEGVDTYSSVATFTTPGECKIVPIITSVEKVCSAEIPQSRLKITFTDQYVNQDYNVKFSLNSSFTPGTYWQATVAANTEKTVTYPLGFVPDLNRPNSSPPILLPTTKYYISVARRTFAGGESLVYEVDGVDCGNVTVIPTRTTIPSQTPTVTPTRVVPTSTPIPGSVTCGLIDVNDDTKLDITDFIAFSKVYKKICNDVPPKVGCGGKDVIFNGVYNGMLDINDFIYFTNHYYTIVPDCTIY